MKKDTLHCKFKILMMFLCVMQVLSCEPGSYVNNDDCLQCSPGTYSSSGTVTACSVCKEGSYSVVGGATACVGCKDSSQINHYRSNDMPIALTEYAGLVFDGKLYIGGGNSGVLQVYDSLVGLWNVSSLELSVRRHDLASAVVGHMACFAGGLVDMVTPTDVTDVFNLLTGTRTTGRLNDARGGLAGVAVSSLGIFAGGGTDSSPYCQYDTIDIYNATSNEWGVSEHTLSAARERLSAASTGMIAMIAGGTSEANPCYTNIDIYNGYTSTWLRADLSVGRYDIAAANLGNFLFFGGGFVQGEVGSSAVVDYVDTTSMTWSVTNMPTAGYYFVAAAIGCKVIFAGMEEGAMYIFDILTRTWYTFSNNIFASRIAFIGFTVGSLVIFPGGQMGDGTWLSTVEYFSWECKLGVGGKCACDPGFIFNGFKCESCTPGSYSAGGIATSCTQCPAGSYSASSGIAVCTLCPAGTYGAFTGLNNSICSGVCIEGYYCPQGSTSGLSVACPAGTYGSTTGLSSNLCSGICEEGYYGLQTALTTPQCSGRCQDSFACPAGTVTPKPCPIGSYCQRGIRTMCPIGTYGSDPSLSFPSCSGKCLMGYFGDQAGLTSAVCSGACNAGYYCHTGSTSSQQVTCPKGSFCTGGSANPTPCPNGYYGSTTALSSAVCSGLCQVGYYCLSGSTTAIEYICSVGSYCVGGNVNSCPVGTYGNTTGLSSTSCSGPCQEGYYGIQTGLTTAQCTGRCNDSYACPAGTVTPLSCPIGSYCQLGIRKACPMGTYGSSMSMSSPSCSGECTAGSYGNQTGLTTSSCCGICDGGYYCPAGSTSSDDLNHACDAGTYSLPAATTCQSCHPGFYSSAESSSCTLCPVGTYSSFIASSSCSRCQAGYFGNSPGLTSPYCTAMCFASTYSSPDGTRCLYCPSGENSEPGSGSCSRDSNSPLGSSNLAIIVGCSAGVGLLLFGVLFRYVIKKRDANIPLLDNYSLFIAPSDTTN